MSAIRLLGSGIVGSRIRNGFAHLGHNVIFNNINIEKIQRLIYEHTATTDLAFAMNNSEISFGCLPIHFNNDFDNRFIVSDITDISYTPNKKDGISPHGHKNYTDAKNPQLVSSRWWFK